MPRLNLLAFVYFVYFDFHIWSASSFVSPNNLINVSEACDLDWTYFEPTNKCYKVIVDDMNWDQAVQTCVDMDSIIVSIHSRQHNEFLINMTLSIQPPNITEMYAFWIGYYETYNVSRWMNAYYLTNFQWLDGSMMDFVNWAIIYLGTYEPDYYYFAYTPLQANRSCAVLLADYHGHTTYWRLIKTTWFDDDYGCESLYSGTICQRDSKVSLSITENNDLEFTCDKGWIGHGVTNILNQTKHMCYKYVYQRQMDYYDAVQRCESMNSTIVYIENEDETNFLINLDLDQIMKHQVPSLSLLAKVVDQNESSNPYSPWCLHIGLTDYNNSGIWRWPDGTPADFVKWYANEPQYGRKVNNISCAYLVYGETYQMFKGKIFQSDCNVAFERTICKKSAISRKKLDNSTVSIIGLNDLNAGKITPIAYPTNILSLMEKYYNIRSTGIHCTNDSSAPCPLKPFVCPLSGKQHVNIVDTDSSTLCEPGWIYFNRTNKCYQIFLKDMNLFDAIETCNSLNSTLASIHGESHNDFLISMARSLPKAANTSFYALWIGFMNYEHAFEYMTGNCQYGWSWSDGSVVDYVRWTRYMPIGMGRRNTSCSVLVVDAQKTIVKSSSYYVHMNLTSLWIDVDLIRQSCYSNFPGAICQRNSTNVINKENGSSINVSNLECDQGWTRYELKNNYGDRYNMCYYVIYNQSKITYDEALQTCLAMNSSLAVLENQDEHQFIKEDLIIRSNTLSTYAFWVNPIADECIDVLKPGWKTSYGFDNIFDGYFSEYGACCDSTLYWVNTSTNSEYFPFRMMEPYFYLNKSCIVLSIDGDNIFEIQRNGAIMAEFCEYPHIGAICKKKPDRLPVPRNQTDSPSGLKSSQNTRFNIKVADETTTYSSTYKSTLNSEFCLNPPSNFPSMLVARDTRHYNLSRTKDPIAICPCADGNRMYWAPSNDSMPSSAYNNSELSWILYQYEKTFEENGLWDGVHDFCDKGVDCIERNNYCPSMCICDVEGHCYKSYRYNTEVLFVPYCDESGCYVYAAVSMGKLCRGCDRNNIDICWGCVEHDATKDPISSSSRYIKVDKVGCFDCINIIYTKCPADDFSNVGLPGWPSVVSFGPISSPHSLWVKRSMDPERFLSWYFSIDSSSVRSWAPYIIHPKILNRQYATDAMKDILYECVWFYGFHFNETGGMTQNFDYSYLAKQTKFINQSSNGIMATDYIAGQFDWGFMKSMSGMNLFNEARRGFIELLLENAMRTNNFNNFGEYCSALNYGRFQQVRPGIVAKWQNGIEAFDKLRSVNFGLNMFFGIIGIFISLVVIRLIHRNKELQTPYGFFCLFQAYNDLILVGDTVFFEGFMTVRTMYFGIVENLGEVDFTVNSPSLPWRWDYLMYYVFYSSKFATSIIVFLKAFTRFVAVYFPMFFYYNRMFDSKHTILSCSGILLLMFFISMPMMVPPQWIASMCKVIFARSQYIQLDTCSQIYWWVQTYAEFIFAIFCFLFDMATFYKLVRINRAKKSENDHVESQRRLLERLFFIQNIGNLVSFVIMFIPNMIYALGCNYDRWHCISGGNNAIVTTIYQITVLLFLHTSRITIWRCFDEFVSILCQWRILRQSPTKTKVQQLVTDTTNNKTLTTSVTNKVNK